MNALTLTNNHSPAGKRLLTCSLMGTGGAGSSCLFNAVWENLWSCSQKYGLSCLPVTQQARRTADRTNKSKKEKKNKGNNE
jgi:predicted GTPase